MKGEKFFGPELAALTGEERWPAWMQAVKREAVRRVLETGMPGRRNEDWRKTPIRRFFQKDFRTDWPETEDYQADFSAWESDLKAGLLNGLPAYTGHTRDGAPRPVVMPLSRAVEAYPDLLEKHFNVLASRLGGVMTALNTALFRDGLLVYVPEGAGTWRMELTTDLTQADSLTSTRLLVYVAPGNDFRLWWRDRRMASGAVAVDTAEYVVAPGSRLQVITNHSAAGDAARLVHHFFRLEGDAQVRTWSFPPEGALVRNEQYAVLTGREARFEAGGLYVPGGERQADHKVFVSHEAPHTYSSQLFKGIIYDRAKAWFKGYILVRPGAGETDAYQKNDHILLSDQARAYSRPFLEIYEDNVSCSHGSTTGRLDDEMLFYMQQRGLARDEARRLLLKAFGGEVLLDMDEPFIRQWQEARLDEALQALPAEPIAASALNHTS